MRGYTKKALIFSQFVFCVCVSSVSRHLITLVWLETWIRAAVDAMVTSVFYSEHNNRHTGTHHNNAFRFGQDEQRDVAMDWTESCATASTPTSSTLISSSSHSLFLLLSPPPRPPPHRVSQGLK